MARRNRVSLSFSGFEEMAERLDRIGGDLKKTASDALIASKTHVAKNLLSATQKSKYPAHGKYSKGTTRHSIDTQKNVEWNGDKGSIPIGFDFDKSGMTSIFLMYGTPRMAKVQEVYDAVYGSKTKRDIKKLQKDIFTEAINNSMWG